MRSERVRRGYRRRRVDRREESHTMAESKKEAVQSPLSHCPTSSHSAAVVLHTYP